jgi:hypothetical protein
LPFDRPFDKLRAVSGVERLRAMSKVEWLRATLSVVERVAPALLTRLRSD